METKRLMQLVCYLELVVVFMCADAQRSCNADDPSGGISWISPFSTQEGTLGTISWKEKNDFSTSFQMENEDRNVTSTTSLWLWQPIIWSRWVIFQMIAALLGIVGNLLVIILLFQRRKKRKSTDTLVGALATADICTSIFMIPLPSAIRVPSTILGEIYCRIARTSYLMWVSVVASILTLTFIPVEQYIAVVYPFRRKEILSRKRILVGVVLIWLGSFMLNSASLFITTVDPSQQKCNFCYQSRTMQIMIGIVLFITEFLVPIIITLTLQVLTARVLHHQSRRFLGSDNRLDISNPSTRHLIAKKRVLQTVFIVVLVFIVSWGPDQILHLAFNLKLIPASYLYSSLYRAVTVFGFCNSCANPIIYTARYPEFRRAMRELLTPAKQTDAPLFDERERRSAFQPKIIPDVC